MSKTKSFYWDSIEQDLNYHKHQAKPPLEAHREHLEQAREGAKYLRSQEVKKRLLERFRGSKTYYPSHSSTLQRVMSPNEALHFDVLGFEEFEYL